MKAKSLIVYGIEFRVFNHALAVSRSGDVLHLHTLEMVTPVPLRAGYLLASRNRGKFLVHRMVATAWLPPPKDSETEVHHINEIKTDNRAENLMWVCPIVHRTELHDSASLGRYKRTEETRQKMREYRTGRKSTEETKMKQRIASLRLGLRPPARPIGYKVPQAEVDAMSENHWRNTQCEIDGIAYRSFAEAGRALGIRPLTLRKRCLAATFPNYKVLK